jgi:hypothetical protein
MSWNYLNQHYMLDQLFRFFPVFVYPIILYYIFIRCWTLGHSFWNKPFIHVIDPLLHVRLRCLKPFFSDAIKHNITHLTFKKLYLFMTQGVILNIWLSIPLPSSVSTPSFIVLFYCNVFRLCLQQWLVKFLKRDTHDTVIVIMMLLHNNVCVLYNSYKPVILR